MTFLKKKSSYGVGAKQLEVLQFAGLQIGQKLYTYASLKDRDMF